MVSGTNFHNKLKEFCMKNNRYVFVFLFLFAFGAIAAYASPVHEIEKGYERGGYNYVVQVQFYNRSNANQALQMVWGSVEDETTGPTEDGLTMKVVPESELKLAPRAFNDIKNDREFRDWARDADYAVMIIIMNLKTFVGEGYVVTRETVGSRELIKTKAWFYQKSAQSPQSQAPAPQPQQQSQAPAPQPQQQSQPQNTATAKSYADSGYAAIDRKDYNKAIADYTEAIRLNPNENYYFWRAYAYKYKGDYDRAITDYTQRIIRIDPNSNFDLRRGYIDRAEAYILKGDYDKAIADCNEALRLNQKDVAAYSCRAKAYNGKRDYDKAIADATYAIQLEPTYRIPYGYRGFAYMMKGNYTQARADVDKFRQLYPSYFIREDDPEGVKNLDAELKRKGY